MAPQYYSVTKFKILDLQHHINDRPIPNGGEDALPFQHTFPASYGGDSQNSLCSSTTRPATLDPPDRGSQSYSFVECGPGEPPTPPSRKISVTNINTEAAKSRATRKKAAGKTATANDRERRSAKSAVEGELKKKGKGRKANGNGKKTDGKKKTAGEKPTGENAEDSMALDSQPRGRSDDVPPPAQEAQGSSGATWTPTASQADPAAHDSPYSSLGKDVAPGARPAMLAVPPQSWSDYPDQEDIAAASATAPTRTTAIPAAAQAPYQCPRLYAGTRSTAAAWEHTAAPAVPAQDWNHYPRSNEQMAPSANTYGSQYSPYLDETAVAGAAVPVHTPALPVAVQGPHNSPSPYQGDGPAAATWQQAAALASSRQEATYQHPHFYTGSRPTPAAWEHTAAPAVPAQGWSHYPRSNEQIAPSADAYRSADEHALAARGWQYPPYPGETAAASAAAPPHTAALPLTVQGPFPYPVPAGATWQQAAETASSQQQCYQTGSQTDQRAGTEEVAWTPTAGLRVPVQGGDFGSLTDDRVELSTETVALETTAQGRCSYLTNEELGSTDAYAPTYASTTPDRGWDHESSSDDGLLTPPPPPLTMDGMYEPSLGVTDDLFDSIVDKDAMAGMSAILGHLMQRAGEGTWY